MYSPIYICIGKWVFFVVVVVLVVVFLCGRLKKKQKVPEMVTTQ